MARRENGGPHAVTTLILSSRSRASLSCRDDAYEERAKDKSDRVRERWRARARARKRGKKRRKYTEEEEEEEERKEI